MGVAKLLIAAVACLLALPGLAHGRTLASTVAAVGQSAGEQVPGPRDSHPQNGARQLQEVDFSTKDIPIKDIRQGLARHNRLRARHKAPPLKWSEELAWYATIYVQGRSANGCGGTLRGTTDGFPTTVTLSITASFGVNDTTDDVPPPSLVEATDAWYSQVEGYQFSPSPWSDNGGNRLRAAGFVQIVWRNATALGCAAASGRQGIGPRCAAVVCFYQTTNLPVGYGPVDPAVDQIFRENVLPDYGTPSKAALPYSGLEDFQQGLIQINKYRLRHQAPPLLWSGRLRRSTLTRAAAIVSGGCDAKKFAAGPGESAAIFTYKKDSFEARLPPSLRDASQAWVAQAVSFKVGARQWAANRANFTNLRGFTQLVWQASTHVGCSGAKGLLTNGDTCSVVVCQYSPAGNTPQTDAAFNANVKPAAAAKPREETLFWTVWTKNYTDGIRQVGLPRINQYRAAHGAPPLSWDAKLAELASPYIESYNVILLNWFNAWPYGVTAYARCFDGGTNDADVLRGTRLADAADAWYSEVEDYVFNTTTPFTDNWRWPASPISSFSQLVWKGTKRVGCATNRGIDEYYGVCSVQVCLFSPKGNARDDKVVLANVLPASA